MPTPSSPRTACLSAAPARLPSPPSTRRRRCGRMRRSAPAVLPRRSWAAAAPPARGPASTRALSSPLRSLAWCSMSPPSSPSATGPTLRRWRRPRPSTWALSAARTAAAPPCEQRLVTPSRRGQAPPFCTSPPTSCAPPPPSSSPCSSSPTPPSPPTCLTARPPSSSPRPSSPEPPPGCGSGPCR